MKLRCALVLFLAACACAFGQSASTILSSLRIKGATSEGGDPKYENYIPRLDSNGTLPLSVIPEYLYTNIVDWVNEHGSEYDRKLLETVDASIDIRVRAALSPIYSEISDATNDLYTLVLDAIPSHETDPLFTEKILGDSLQVGKNAVAVDGATQLAEGTNSVSGTFKFKDVVLVDTNGVIPEATIPWAASTEYVNIIAGNATSNNLLKSGDIMLGSLGFTNTGVKAATFEKSNTHQIGAAGTVVFDQSDVRGAEFSGTYYISPTSNVAEVVNPGFYKIAWCADYDEPSGGYISTNSITEHVDIVTLFNASGANNAEITLQVVTNSVCVYSENISAPVIDDTAIDDAGAVLYRLSAGVNPSGITLNSINEPVDHVDLTTPSGYIFRLTCTDAGNLIVTKIK